MKLADCATGFGSKTTGGKDGRFYIVTSSDDHPQNPKPGTLRYGIIQEKPLWIYFARDMTIKLKQELNISSHKTLDGRGANVHITDGPCLSLKHVSNVIIHGLHIHGCHGVGDDGDAISVLASRNIWIDHNSLSACADGLIDVTHASTLVTVSNNHFSNHNKVMLLGHSDKYFPDTNMKVTVVFNHFATGLVQRMPRCRFGYFHIANNDYDGWGQYAIGGSAAPTIISGGNRFRSPGPHKEVTLREDTTAKVWIKWSWRSIADTFLEGAYFVQSGPSITTNSLHYSGKFHPYMTAFAGAISCSTSIAC